MSCLSKLLGGPHIMTLLFEITRISHKYSLSHTCTHTVQESLNNEKNNDENANSEIGKGESRLRIIYLYTNAMLSTP